MDNADRKAVPFLDSINMGFDDKSFPVLRDHCLAEMEKGLAGKKSSLEMIPTYISAGLPFPENTPCVTVDAGGTNLRIGVVEFGKDREPRIDFICRMPMPGCDREISTEEFFDEIAGPISLQAGDVPRIGFVFSYPAQSTPLHDARVIALSKGICVKGLEGHLLGEGLTEALKRRAKGAFRPPRIVVMNDTTATLLVTGRRQVTDGHASGGFIPAALILGTGLNIAYAEASGVINTEMAGATFCPRGEADDRLDIASNNPGKQLMEKMISGAYIGPLVSTTIRIAAERGLFSSAANPDLTAMPEIRSHELNDWISGSIMPPAGRASIFSSLTAEDFSLISCLARRLIRRGAFYCATGMSAAIARGSRVKPGVKNVVIACNGSTLEKLDSVRKHFESYLAEHVIAKEGFRIEYVYEAEGPMIGAAIAGLTN